MDPTSAAALAILGVIWLAFLFLTFRPPNTPRLARLFFFLVWLGATATLGYCFLIKVYKFNPDPIRVEMARKLTKDRMIYLGDVVPGSYDLDYIHRIDTDHEDEDIKEEWMAFYRYDVRTDPEKGTYQGPFGAAIYDYDDCRPPAILSFELVPASYDYLAEDDIDVAVEDIVSYSDPLSGSRDRSEVIVAGKTRGVVTDLNIFRKVGVELDCFQRQQWLAAHPGEAFPVPLRYENIGSFRGSYRVERNGSTVTVVDRAGFERSQFTLRRQYRHQNGSYFRPGTQVLLDPVEYSLAFGPGQPDEVSQVYYPEKAVLAFYLNLTKDEKQLERAKGYLSPDAQALYNIETDPFGLAMPREELARVLVWQIRYEPDIEAEQLHRDRQVTVTVVGVDKDGYIDYAHPCRVTWAIVGKENSNALPYGCEWRLGWYQSNCLPGG